MAREKEGVAKGVLDPGRTDSKFHFARYHPSDALAPFVEHYWTVVWDLTGQPAQTQEVLPYPSVHLVLERGRTELVGVMTGKFARRLEGAGRVFGIKFHPGGFFPFAGVPIASLTDGRWNPRSWLRGDVDALEAGVLSSTSEHTMVALAETFLTHEQPVADEGAARVAEIVRRVAEDRGIVRVRDLEEVTGLGVRALQRMFRRYVGVSPKWVVRRYRLHEAAARLAEAPPLDQAALAQELGYADQAHFIRDFRELVGVTPGVYARRNAPDSGVASVVARDGQ